MLMSHLRTWSDCKLCSSDSELQSEWQHGFPDDSTQSVVVTVLDTCEHALMPAQQTPWKYRAGHGMQRYIITSIDE